MTIIVSFAVRAEFAPWRRLESFERVGESSRPIYVTKIGGAEVYVLIGGIGTRGTASLRKLLEQRPDMCVVSGLAGSLKRNHAVGTVVVATTIKRDNPDGVVTSDDSLLELALQCGATRVDSFLTADAVVTSASDKLRLGAIADAVEMESFHLMAETRQYGVRAVAVRAICDGVDQDLPLDFNQAIKDDGRFDWLPALSQVVSAPIHLPRLVRFGFQTSKAARSLAQFLDRYLKCLIAQADLRLNAERVEVR